MMEEFVRLCAEIDKYQCQTWEKNKMVEVEGFGEHLYFPQHPYRFFIKRKQEGDMVWTVCYDKLFISERLHQIFLESGITGYEPLPADAKLIYEHDPAEAVYWQVAVNGWGGIASPDSGLQCIDDSVVPRRYKKYEGTGSVLNREQWDGSDFFMIWPSPMIIVTRRVIQLLEKHKIKHYRTFSADCYQSMHYERAFSGPPLQCWYREDRAREIGEPLGLYWKSEKDDNA
jgi:hypothetical protein